MNRAEVIAMAQKAGAFIELSTTPEKDVAFLQKFAALVAAAEREECAKICDFLSKEAPFVEEQWAFDDAARAIRARGNT